MNDAIAANYERAQTILQGYHSNSLVINDAVFPHWIVKEGTGESHTFWYIKETKSGKQYRMVDVRTGENNIAFDHNALASDLSGDQKNLVLASDLPITDVNIGPSNSEGAMQVTFKYHGNSFVFSTQTNQCRQLDTSQEKNPESTDDQAGINSPDGKYSVFKREDNLWLKHLDSGETFALTNDGSESFSYGGSFLSIDKALQVRWSPDSKRLFAVCFDTQAIATRSMLSYVPANNAVQPELTQFKAAYPGDKNIESYKLLTIDVLDKTCQFADYPNIPHIAQGPETHDGFFTAGLGWWSKDSRSVFFIDVARGAKKISVVKWDTVSGSIDTLFSEASDYYLSLAEDSASSSLFFPIPETNELVWLSERTGWPQLFLYDLSSGQLKHQISGVEPESEGEWLVRGVLHYDSASRELLLQTAARDSSISPYYRDICKINIDTRELKPVRCGNVDHMIYSPRHGLAVSGRELYQIDSSDDVNGVSPCGHYIVTTYSRVDTLPVTVLLDRNGNELLTVEKAIANQLPDDWQWPEPFKVKAADDKTDIYGLLFRPPGFDEGQRYPVIDFFGCTRHLKLIPEGSFINSIYTEYFEMAALAALGFIVVGMAGRGTPHRDKEFQTHQYGVPGRDDEVEDHIAGIQQLAKRYPSMDSDRVGATCLENVCSVIYAALKYSDFYKASVVHCFGDERYTFVEHEMYSNILTKADIDASDYPEAYAKDLNGKLLLIYSLFGGTESAMRLMCALQKAHKDFDTLCLPHMGTVIMDYTRRRGWDHFVRHLQGVTPPHEFPLLSGQDYLLDKIMNPSTASHSVEES